MIPIRWLVQRGVAVWKWGQHDRTALLNILGVEVRAMFLCPWLGNVAEFGGDRKHRVKR